MESISGVWCRFFRFLEEKIITNYPILAGLQGTCVRTMRYRFKTSYDKKNDTFRIRCARESAEAFSLNPPPTRLCVFFLRAFQENTALFGVVRTMMSELFSLPREAVAGLFFFDK